MTAIVQTVFFRRFFYGIYTTLMTMPKKLWDGSLCARVLSALANIWLHTPAGCRQQTQEANKLDQSFYNLRLGFLSFSLFFFILFFFIGCISYTLFSLSPSIFLSYFVHSFFFFFFTLQTCAAILNWIYILALDITEVDYSLVYIYTFILYVYMHVGYIYIYIYKLLNIVHCLINRQHCTTLMLVMKMYYCILHVTLYLCWSIQKKSKEWKRRERFKWKPQVDQNHMMRI